VHISPPAPRLDRRPPQLELVLAARERELQSAVDRPALLHGNAVDVEKTKTGQPNRLIQEIVGMGGNGNRVLFRQMQKPGNVLPYFGIKTVAPARERIHIVSVGLGFSVGYIKQAEAQTATALITHATLKTIIWNGRDVACPSLVVIGLEQERALGEEVASKIVFAFGYNTVKNNAAKVLVDNGSFAGDYENSRRRAEGACTAKSSPGRRFRRFPAGGWDCREYQGG